MTTNRGLALALPLLLLAMGSSMADEGDGAPLDDSRFRYHGEVRFRGELYNNYRDFNDDGRFFDPMIPDDDSVDVFPYRVRLAVEGTIAENLIGQVQLQVGDKAGADLQPGVLQTNEGFPRTGEIVLYTGFIHWNRVAGTDWNMRFGRQELRIGNEFLFGDLDYYNGTSFDAWRIHWNGEPVQFQFFWAQTAETLSDHIEANIFAASLDGHLERGDDWSIFTGWIVEEEGPSGIDQMNLFVFGFRWHRLEGEGDHYLWNVELAYEDGRIGNPSVLITDFQRPDFGAPTGLTGSDAFISAWAVEGLFGYNWSRGDNEHRVYAHAYLASGDKEAGDKEDEGFRPLFQDFHNRLGRADIVQGTNINSFGVAYEGRFGEKHAAGVDLMTFTINEAGGANTCLARAPGDFGLNNPVSLQRNCLLNPDADSFQGWFIPAVDTLSDPDLAAEDDLGQELDFWYDYFMSSHVSFKVELSIFFPGDALTQLRDVDDFDTLLLAPLPDHAPTMLATQTTILNDDPVTRLSAQVRLRY